MNKKKDPIEIIGFTLGEITQEGKLLNLRRETQGKSSTAEPDEVEMKRIDNFRKEHTIRLNPSLKQKSRFAWLSKLLFWRKK